MEFTSLDAIEFAQDGKKQLRVYYQTTDDGVIRESSFDQQIGWFVRGDGVVSNKAKNKSPITATRWNKGDETQIRVYFLDPDDNICECHGTYKSGNTTWRPAKVLKAHRNPQPKVAKDSQLAVARPDEADKKLRIFYQEKDEAKGTYHFCELHYTRHYPNDGTRPEDRLGAWVVEGVLNRSVTAPLGTRISAVSNRNAKHVHLFYQGDEGHLMEAFWDENRRWSIPQPVLEDSKLAPGAPISALSYHTGDVGGTQSSPTQNIRVFTVFESPNNRISQLSFFDGDWWSETVISDDIHISKSSTPEYSSVAVARDIKANDNGPIHLFYQPDPRVIDLIPVASDGESQTSKDELKNVKLPRGIPTSRGTLVRRVTPSSPNPPVIQTPTSATGTTTQGITDALPTVPEPVSHPSGTTEPGNLHTKLAEIGLNLSIDTVQALESSVHAEWKRRHAAGGSTTGTTSQPSTHTGPTTNSNPNQAASVEAPNVTLSGGGLPLPSTTTFNAQTWYKFKNSLVGHALDVVNDGQGSRAGTIQMAAEGNYSGQYWQLRPRGDGSYNLCTMFLGAQMQLDVYGNDKSKPHLAPAGNHSGQQWQIKPWGGGSFYLTNSYSGPAMLLDSRDGSNEPYLDASNDTRATKYWHITPIRAITESGFQI